MMAVEPWSNGKRRQLIESLQKQVEGYPSGEDTNRSETKEDQMHVLKDLLGMMNNEELGQLVRALYRKSPKD